jgi:molybdopterin-binding protein
MNSIEATIQSIENYEGIARIVLDKEGKKLTAITLELPSSLHVGSACRVLFKETEVGLAKNLCGTVSFSNRFKGCVKELKKGALLSRILVGVESDVIASIVTTHAIEQLALEVGDELEVLIKATEVSLEVIV